MRTPIALIPAYALALSGGGSTTTYPSVEYDFSPNY